MRLFESLQAQEEQVGGGGGEKGFGYKGFSHHMLQPPGCCFSTPTLTFPFRHPSLLLPLVQMAAGVAERMALVKKMDKLQAEVRLDDERVRGGGGGGGGGTTPCRGDTLQL